MKEESTAEISDQNIIHVFWDTL